MYAPHKTDYQVKMLMKNHPDGPPDRRETRHQCWMLNIKQLQARGYSKRWDINTLGKKDVCRLVDDWRTQGLSNRTIANRLVHIRWLARKVNLIGRIPTNRQLGIGLRKNAPGFGTNKAVKADPALLALLPEREQIITLLRILFGLRTEESLKFQYAVATQKPGFIQLKGSWCKGGRPREIEIINDQQRDLLERVTNHQQQNGDKSMIPSHRTYKNYYARYNKLRRKYGIKGHEYRHQWAQERFLEASGGILAPHAGGPRYADLTPEEKARWDKAAKVVNWELGHGMGRDDITATYIGSRKSD
ncbi:MAG: integrase domain-containing protein [Gammaproteobacteria bacterium]|nr:integrase domain-containing protein [Gammaproteobacteria bacterium]